MWSVVRCKCKQMANPTKAMWSPPPQPSKRKHDKNSSIVHVNCTNRIKSSSLEWCGEMQSTYLTFRIPFLFEAKIIRFFSSNFNEFVRNPFELIWIWTHVALRRFVCNRKLCSDILRFDPLSPTIDNSNNSFFVRCVNRHHSLWNLMSSTCGDVDHLNIKCLQ